MNRIVHGDKINLDRLVQKALEAGATGASIIFPAQIVVKDVLADLCREPRCPNYGASRSCPPHVPGPAGFRRKLQGCHWALFFKIDVPSGIIDALALQPSEEGRQVFQLLHETVAFIEACALQAGFKDAQGYAGGSCKTIFCHAHAHCRAIDGNEGCRHPASARPSMSGQGIDVASLFKICGWQMRWTDDDGANLAALSGLVLIK